MKVFRSVKEMRLWRGSQDSVGFVPTMGALHEGHLSLVRRASRDHKRVVVSIFVNPTQFGPKEDFKKYPRTLSRDLELLRRAGVDAVFVPKASEIYARKDETSLLPRAHFLQIMEGRFRPGHFGGVATVVAKLFSVVQPQSAYFGEKDYQQVRVIEALIEDLFLPIRLVRCRTFREKSGLAMSSRNRYLSEAAKEKASLIYRVLKSAKSVKEGRGILKREGFEIQYLEVWKEDLSQPAKNSKGRWFVAAFLDGVRLIDNLKR